MHAEPTQKAARNVKVTVEIEMHVPDAALDSDGPVAAALGTVNDETYDRASDMVAEIWEAGDPADATNAVIIVGSVEYIEASDG